MKYRFTSLISGLLAVVTACSPAVDGNLPDSQFYLLGIDGKEIINKTFYDSQTVGELKVNAYLGGYEGTTGEVSLIADDEVLLKYNETHGSSYMFLPDEYYEIPEGSVKVTPDSRSVSFVCKVDCDGLRALEDLDEYLLPLSIVSDDLPINPAKKSICYRFMVKDLILSLNNPGIEDIHVSTGLDPVREVSVSVVTDGDLCTVDYDYKLYCLDGSAQGEDADILSGLLGYAAPLVSEDAYELRSDYVVKEGTKESVSTLTLKIAELSSVISYIAIALDDDDLTAENILTKAKVYRILRDAELLPRDGWSIPYCNILAGQAGNSAYGTNLLLDGDLKTVWQAPWRPEINSYDPYYEGWTHTHSNYARLPMFCILDMGSVKMISGVKVSRRDGANWQYTKTGEIWISKDTTGDDALKNCFGKSVECELVITEAESKAWNSKQFTKVAEFDFTSVNDNMDQEQTVYFDGQEARYIKVVLTENPVDMMILSLSEINVLGRK